MTETTSPAISDITRDYVAVWNDPDPAARRAAVRKLWAPDGVEFLDGVQYRGHDELEARVGRAYDAFVGSGKYAITASDDVSVHGDLVAFTVHLTKPDGEADWTARVFLLLGPDGQIREDYHIVIKPLPPA
ncbi:MAG TPA: nuclear transport factor 2 family protein [Trebonia sp.]|jgi:hypothetical protein